MILFTLLLINFLIKCYWHTRFLCPVLPGVCPIMLITPVATVDHINRDIGRLVRVFGTSLRLSFWWKNNALKKRILVWKFTWSEAFQRCQNSNNTFLKTNSQVFIFQSSLSSSVRGNLQTLALGQRSTRSLCKGLDSNYLDWVCHVPLCLIVLIVFNVLFKI